MAARFIKAFVPSIQEVFSTMVQMEITIGSPTICDHSTETADVTGVISMYGDIEGTVILSLPLNTAELIASRFAGDEITVDSDDFTDAIGELVNMIAGSAKAKINGGDVSISCPSVVVGSNHSIYNQKKTTRLIEFECKSQLGSFKLHVSIKPIDAPTPVVTKAEVTH